MKVKYHLKSTKIKLVTHSVVKELNLPECWSKVYRPVPNTRLYVCKDLLTKILYRENVAGQTTFVGQAPSTRGFNYTVLLLTTGRIIKPATENFVLQQCYVVKRCGLKPTRS